MPIYGNIAGVSKDIPDWYSNIGGVSKKLNSFLSNINGTSVELLVPTKPYWVLPSSGSGTMGTNTRTRMVSDSVTVSSDGTFTLINATSISGRPAQGKFFVSISTSSNSSATTGSKLYYAINGSGAYCIFNISEGMILSSSSFPSEARNNSPDVFYELNGSNHNLYISKDLIPSLYRWTEYNAKVISTSYEPERFDSTGTINSNFSDSSYYVFASSSIPTINSNGKFVYNNQIRLCDSIGYYVPDEVTSSTHKNANYISDYSLIGGLYYLTYSHFYTVKTNNNYGKGESTGKYAYSTSSSAYPTNGYYSGYWYDNRTTIT